MTDTLTRQDDGLMVGDQTRGKLKLCGGVLWVADVSGLGGAGYRYDSLGRRLWYAWTVSSCGRYRCRKEHAMAVLAHLASGIWTGRQTMRDVNILRYPIPSEATG